jgi:hypothetical protein
MCMQYLARVHITQSDSMCMQCEACVHSILYAHTVRLNTVHTGLTLYAHNVRRITMYTGLTLHTNTVRLSTVGTGPTLHTNTVRLSTVSMQGLYTQYSIGQYLYAM